MLTRREMMTTAAIVGGAALLKNVPAVLAVENPTTTNEASGEFAAVYTPNGVSLPWKMVDGVKVYHLIAEEVEHEFAPGLKAHCCG